MLLVDAFIKKNSTPYPGSGPILQNLIYIISIDIFFPCDCAAATDRFYICPVCLKKIQNFGGWSTIYSGIS